MRRDTNRKVEREGAKERTLMNVEIGHRRTKKRGASKWTVRTKEISRGERKNMCMREKERRRDKNRDRVKLPYNFDIVFRNGPANRLYDCFPTLLLSTLKLDSLYEYRPINMQWYLKNAPQKFSSVYRFLRNK